MALLRLKMDIPKEVLPSNWGEPESERVRGGVELSPDWLIYGLLVNNVSIKFLQTDYEKKCPTLNVTPATYFAYFSLHKNFHLLRIANSGEDPRR